MLSDAAGSTDVSRYATNRTMTDFCGMEIRTGGILIGWINLLDQQTIIAGLIGIVGVNIILLLGIHKTNKYMLLPWLAMKTVAFSILSIMWVYAMIALIAWDDVGVAFVIFVIGLPTCVLPWYCWYCVYTLYLSFNYKSAAGFSEKE